MLARRLERGPRACLTGRKQYDGKRFGAPEGAPAMSRRHELTDAEWALIAPLMPPPSRGRAWADHRTVISGAMYWAATGIPWRDLPERFGPWQTVYERFRRWRRDGTWLRILRHLQGEADRRGLI